MSWHTICYSICINNFFFVGFFVEPRRRAAKARLPDTFRETNHPLEVKT